MLTQDFWTASDIHIHHVAEWRSEWRVGGAREKGAEVTAKVVAVTVKVVAVRAKMACSSRFGGSCL